VSAGVIAGLFVAFVLVVIAVELMERRADRVDHDPVTARVAPDVSPGGHVSTKPLAADGSPMAGLLEHFGLDPDRYSVRPPDRK
jgi:hypothetical protein